MKFTNYFSYTKLRQDRISIKDEYIEFTFLFPIKTEIQEDGRYKFWSYIENEKKYLRIIVLEDKETIHNAFWDRSFKN